MDYELCKKLKDAGFPQCDEDGCFKGTMLFNKVSLADTQEKWSERSALSPTLSELIEALGNEEEFCLLREDENWIAWYKNPTQSLRLGEAEGVYEGLGKTPEEAVAKLWLAIHSQELKDSKDMID